MIGSTLTLKAGAVLLADIPTNPCPKAPPGLSTPMGDFTGYAKYIVLWSIGIGFLSSLAALGVGRIADHRAASKWGAVGMGISLLAAAFFGAGPAMLSAVSGKGC